MRAPHRRLLDLSGVGGDMDAEIEIGMGAWLQANLA